MQSARSARLGGYRERHLRCRRMPGAGDRRAGRRGGRVGLRGRPANTVPGSLVRPPVAPVPALPKAADEPAVQMLLDTVRPGGPLLAVYHDLNDEHREP